MKPDLKVTGGGSIFLLRGVTARGREWIDQNISQDRTEFGGAIVVEHRYITDIVIGARRDGLRVQ